MTRKYLIALFGLTTFLISSFVSAALINQSEDGLNWNLDETTGLQWLDLTHTTGLSYNQVFSSYSDWTLATETQWQDMYSCYFDGDLADAALNGETSGYGVSDGYEWVSQGNSDFAGEFTEYESYFGQSFYSYEKAGGAFDINSYRETFYSFGLYSNDVDPGYSFNSRLRLGGMAISIERTNANYTSYIENHVDSTGNYGSYGPWDDPYSVPDHGWYLVRQAPEEAAEAVPAPSVIALMLIGMLGFGVRRKKLG